MNKSLELPRGWQAEKLGSFVEMKYGKGLTKAARSENGRFNVYGSNGIVGKHTDYLVKEPCVIVGRKGAAGEVHISDKPCWPIDTTYFVLPPPNIDLHFLYFQLKHLRLSSLEKSTAIPGLSRSDAYQKLFVLPPLTEQHRIVEQIEALFSELKNGIEQLKTAHQQLKVYRQAVLKWAFEGKLTNESVVDGELPKGWKWVKLGDVCDKIQDGSHFSPQVQYDEPGEGRFMYITAKNVRNNFMDLSKLTFIDKEFHESIYERCNPEYGDVLLTKDGVNTGEVTLNTLHEPFSLLSSVCIFKTEKSVLKSEFLKYFIQSPLGSRAITDSMTGTAIKRIILRKIRVAEIVMPTLREQEQIVREIESRLSVCDKLEETISESLQQAEALRQSILKKAFEGKLVPQDPNDEPAGVLLERIKEERSATGTQKRSANIERVA